MDSKSYKTMDTLTPTAQYTLDSLHMKKVTIHLMNKGTTDIQLWFSPDVSFTFEHGSTTRLHMKPGQRLFYLSHGEYLPLFVTSDTMDGIHLDTSMLIRLRKQQRVRQS